MMARVNMICIGAAILGSAGVGALGALFGNQAQQRGLNQASQAQLQGTREQLDFLREQQA